MNVTFILPGHGGGGGAHSVVQESVGLKQFGVRPAIATTEHTMDVFRATYPELDEAGVDIAVFQDAKDLADALVRCDLAVATTYESLHLLRTAKPLCGDTKLRTAYYVQDYEPFFVAPGTPEWTRARASYSAMPDQLLFAKTDWLCDVVRANHGQPVTKVSPSIDHKTYYPGPDHTGRRPTICAMIRPKTPRRAPRRTARILEQIAERFDDKVELLAFGASPEELVRNGIRTSERIIQSGHLSREGVAAVLRTSDIFLDLSDYQAFGRTALEGMACGCIPVLPQIGGADQFRQCDGCRHARRRGYPARGIGPPVARRQDAPQHAQRRDQDLSRIFRGESGVHGICCVLRVPGGLIAALPLPPRGAMH
jgi:glycosyltransferase involved in cell wall biosynthesis